MNQPIVFLKVEHADAYGEYQNVLFFYMLSGSIHQRHTN